MSATQTLEEKLESAAEALFETLEIPAGVTMHRGFDADEIGEKAILIAAQDNGVPPDEEEIEPTGNRMLMLGVNIKVPSDYGRTAANELAGMIKDVLMGNSIADQLTAASENFTCQYFRPVDVVRSADEHSFTSIITAECWCSPSDFEEEDL
ncbi:MAG TPA: hypothetical protein VJ904_01145 [Tichowtungia sp.]|nr:hypothetical protein [Tichowtungia sp.]